MTNNKGGAQPIVDDETFIRSWNDHSGDARKVAKELGMKYNSAWVRGTRLLKKYGVQKPGINMTFDMNYEKLESENDKHR